MRSLRLLPYAFVGIWVAWFIALLRHGSGDPAFFGNQAASDFARSGAFGDSFGVVASLMTALAAAGAFAAYVGQKEDAKHQQFERKFYSLLDNFQLMVSQIDATVTKPSQEDGLRNELRHIFGDVVANYTGRDAFRIHATMLRLELKPQDFYDSKTVHRKYTAYFCKWVDDLGHYFRTLYQIFKLIEEQCPGDKMYYARIVRAHLSNSEQVLLAYNLIVGEGRHKFVKYAEKFAVLHNIHREGLNKLQKAELRFFERKLPKDVFRFKREQPFTY